MTAEIAIMNKSAIALAADSAVTVSSANSSQHVYHGVNKLFALSHSHPVAIMIYDSAEFMEIPWETVIKSYRVHIGPKKFDQLEQYLSDFVSYLEKDKTLLSKDRCDRHVASKVFAIYNHLREEIDEQVKKTIAEKKSISNAKISQIKAKVMRDFLSSLRAKEDLRKTPSGYKKKFLLQYQQLVDSVIDNVFKNHQISSSLKGLLTEIALQMFIKNEFPFPKSGVVFAGYGPKDIFPKLISLQVECAVNGMLKYVVEKKQEITLDNHASITAFAQSDMVQSFMEGIHPYHRKYIEKNLARLLKHLLPEYISKEICEAKDKQSDEIVDKLQKVGEGVLREFDKELQKDRTNNFVLPITNSVSHLPKDELAAMAESLVNLTSFRQKISLGTSGTVGGEIDVAVISKGDGFVWIKRKHYFESELNPHFMANYIKD
ncbi:MAG: hypothetical protein OEV87_02785 [Phycisphaerae bacterium]|nr:hypothetical protein [Phycisphaerae bacterium]